ncbi:Calcium uptake protein 1, mitochondrial isoform X2 [Oopsacas minuta]|uniref:Calcium uptake protein 1, mitochondrial isoform X2 n=1 Tax=Oopsacas minuta TaxID=111878 RepID=A0AAV7JGE4_9METZ|nr:Calcium uptake protein 1, mitochondrial isoform X2 [Oopsacas minuta]
MALYKTILLPPRIAETLLITSSYTCNARRYSNTRFHQSTFNWRLYIASGLCITSYFLYKHNYGTNVLCEEALNPTETMPDKIQLKTNAFKRRYTLNYENRIRMYSLPDKIFRYFASIQVEFPDGRTEVFMNPDDFVRSIIPNEMQPTNVDLDHFHKVKSESQTLKHLSAAKSTKSTRFFHTLSTESNGLISLSEYIFLLTILMVPKRKLELIFKAMDLSGDNLVEYEEFQRIEQLIRSRYSGLKVVSANLNNTGGLGEYLFGKDLSKKLSLQELEKFYDDIHHDILKMEFDIYNPTNGKLSEYKFAKFIINSCDFKQDKVEKYLERIEKKFTKKVSQGISFDQAELLMTAVKDIDSIDVALNMYFMGGLSIPQDEFRYVIKCITKIELDEHLVSVLFTLLDQDGDGMLSRKEFVRVIKRRSARGFNKPRDFGFARAVSALFQCGKKVISINSQPTAG